MPMSLLQHNSTPGSSPAQEFSGEFSRDERAQLLQLAHDSISAALESRQISLDPPTAHFAEPRGVFTSLYLRREIESTPIENPQSENPRIEHSRFEAAAPTKVLRGCVGYVLPTCSVYRAVAETARAAAFDDHRFHPVTKEEPPHLAVELSILSPPHPIQPEEIEIGRHGLLVAQHGRRGLLLPQVPVERAWDRITFLEQTCRKAGLPLDAWKNGAAIHAFTAEIFAEK